MKSMFMSIYKAYDVRGVYPKELDEGKAERIAKAFANYMEARKIVVGRDVRKSSPPLSEAVVKGLVNQGCMVVDLGVVTTPMLYYYVTENDLKAGVMVTASHSPKEYNGLKLCGKGGVSLTYDSGIRIIEKMTEKKFSRKPGGDVMEVDVRKEYADYLTRRFRGRLPDKRVIVDCGNGSASVIAKKVFHHLGAKTEMLYCKPDGNFPNRSPEPNDRSLARLKTMVKTGKADLGIAFDGDADRCEFVTDKGIVSPDVILMFLARKLVKKGDKVVYCVRCTKALEALVRHLGGTPIEVRAGRAYIKKRMIEEEALLGGEYSGHFFFRENNYMDDGLYAALRVLSLLEGELPISTYPGEDYRLKTENPEKVLERTEEAFSGQKIERKDGIKVFLDKGWFLLRKSQTEPKVELRLEGYTDSALKEIEELVKEKTGLKF